MDILITDSMLREYLDTKATPSKIAECLSLCGPSIERITQSGKETVYHVEVTTNRIDMASAQGVAQEAAAILPRFDMKATLKELSVKSITAKGSLGVEISIEPSLCERFVAVKLCNVAVGDSPQFIKDRLAAVGQRPLNNIVDITNYVMIMMGIPMHAFDFHKVRPTITVREAKKKESFVTLDGRKHTAQGGEIVFSNEAGDIIDVPGIMGTKNSIVDANTTDVLLVAEHMDPLRVRTASLKHEIRTMAASINEKDPDPNSIKSAILVATALCESYAKATVGSALYDWYPIPRKPSKVVLPKKVLDTVIGVDISKSEVTDILTSLQFKATWKGDTLSVDVPTSRVKDIEIPEDVAEEVARIYGYFNLPSILPTGAIPGAPIEPRFVFEQKIKTLLKGWGGVEVYTLSMVSKMMAGENALRIKNPLGGDGEYMRTQLTPSLIKAAEENTHIKEGFHLFELANVYLSQNKKLPDERMHLSGIFVNHDFRHAKGILEALFQELNISSSPTLTKNGSYFTYEYDLLDLASKSHDYREFQAIPKYPAQVEDVTLVLSADIKVAQVVDMIKEFSSEIVQVDLKDIYEDAYTFRIHYQSMEKTLSNQEVTTLREGLLQRLLKDLKIHSK